MMNKTNLKLRKLTIALCAALLSGCATTKLPDIKPVPNVELSRFMGSWYVIGVIPTYIEKEAYNSVESYKLDADGTIATTFTFNKGAFEGPVKTYTPRGFVVENTNNAEWGMRFIWPIKAEYKIAYLSADYGQTIIARNARDYVWIMARTPVIADSEYKTLTDYVAGLGYDISKLQKVPQQSLNDRNKAKGK
ncbi:lipocalin family protein [Methyloradius palustris]|uniref:Outer membrane lipoprotein Blc n=1 Tax=Methyloradius palustris TaxID=2778876 RepID=A0A8D5FZP4_9PROT|nr:lipocalin family protein [Methyloradius palustris]BCM25142.1 outer membrane lipoprotein [Methyloradius palustris]